MCPRTVLRDYRGFRVFSRNSWSIEQRANAPTKPIPLPRTLSLDFRATFSPPRWKRFHRPVSQTSRPLWSSYFGRASFSGLIENSHENSHPRDFSFFWFDRIFPDTPSPFPYTDRSRFCWPINPFRGRNSFRGGSLENLDARGSALPLPSANLLGGVCKPRKWPGHTTLISVDPLGEGNSLECLRDRGDRG